MNKTVPLGNQSIMNARQMLFTCIKHQWAPQMPEPPEYLPHDLIDFATQKGSLGCVVSAFSQWKWMDLVPEPDYFRASSNLKYTQLFYRGMRNELERFLTVLSSKSIQVVVFKGHDLIEAYYPSDLVRPATDVDILILPETYPVVAQTLRSMGYVGQRGTGNPFCNHWIKGTYLMDIHLQVMDETRMTGRKLMPLLPSHVIFDQARQRQIGQAVCLVPDPAHAFLITCLHALKHSYQKDYWFLDAGFILMKTKKDGKFWKKLMALGDNYQLNLPVWLMLWILCSHLDYPPETIGMELPAGYPGWIVKQLVHQAVAGTEIIPFGEILLGMGISKGLDKLKYITALAYPMTEIAGRELGLGQVHGRQYVYRRTRYLLNTLSSLIVRYLRS